MNADIGRRICDRRLEVGHTQTSLANALFLTSRTTVYQWEKGIYGFTVTSLMRLCRELNVSADWILFGKDKHGDIELWPEST